MHVGHLSVLGACGEVFAHVRVIRWNLTLPKIFISVRTLLLPAAKHVGLSVHWWLLLYHFYCFRKKKQLKSVKKDCMPEFSHLNMALESSASTGPWEINGTILHSDELWRVQIRDALPMGLQKNKPQIKYLCESVAIPMY